jgi:hypothetical protein
VGTLAGLVAAAAGADGALVLVGTGAAVEAGGGFVLVGTGADPPQPATNNEASATTRVECRNFTLSSSVAFSAF